MPWIIRRTNKLLAIALPFAGSLAAQYVPPGGGGGSLPTGSGNCVVASPANGSSATVACRALVGADVSPLTGQVTIGDESLVQPAIQGWNGPGRLYIANSDPTVHGLSVETATNSGKAAIAAIGYAGAGQQATGLSFTAYRASATALPSAYAITGLTYSTATGTTAYGAALGNEFDGVAGDASYGFDSAVYLDNGGSVVTHYDFYGEDQGGKAITNPYYSWFNSRGVRRVKEDATFNSVGQAIEALYNPQFTKYTPGAANFERVVLGQFNSNVAEIGTEAGGTGVLRPLRLIGASVAVPGAGAANTAVCWKAGGVIGWASNSAGVIGTTCN